MVKEGQQNKTGNIFLFPTLGESCSTPFDELLVSGWWEIVASYTKEIEPYLVSTSLVKKETSTDKLKVRRTILLLPSFADLISISSSQHPLETYGGKIGWNKG